MKTFTLTSAPLGSVCLVHLKATNFSSKARNPAKQEAMPKAGSKAPNKTRTKQNILGSVHIPRRRSTRASWSNKRLPNQLIKTPITHRHLATSKRSTVTIRTEALLDRLRFHGISPKRKGTSSGQTKLREGKTLSPANSSILGNHQKCITSHPAVTCKRRAASRGICPPSFLAKITQKTSLISTSQTRPARVEQKSQCPISRNLRI